MRCRIRNCGCSRLYPPAPSEFKCGVWDVALLVQSAQHGVWSGSINVPRTTYNTNSIERADAPSPTGSGGKSEGKIFARSERTVEFLFHQFFFGIQAEAGRKSQDDFDTKLTL